MKKIIFPLLIAIIALSPVIFAQSVTVKPKKTIYARKGKNIPKEKRVFTVTYPIISGAISPAIRKKLENTISYWRVFETTLNENLGDYYWLYELSYKVNYNKNGILDIALTQEGSGAYPDSSTIEKVINLRTGEQAKITDAFKVGSLSKLAEMVNQKLTIEKSNLIAEIDKGKFGDENPDKETNDALKEQISLLEFDKDTFDQYSVNDRGVTFLYDAGFPHVIRAAQPDGLYFFTWTELKPFIKPAGLLGRFVR